jgi:hypothetical protein
LALAQARLAELADIAGGPVPISIAAFWRIVGGVDLAPIEDADLPDRMPTEQRLTRDLPSF